MQSFLKSLLVCLAFTLPLSSLQTYAAPQLDPVEQHEQWLNLSEETDSITLFTKEKTPSFPTLSKALVNPQEGLLAKILAIRNAKYTVDVSTFIFKRDAVGYAILEELKQALKRGVSVRILIDSLGSPHPFHSELKALLEVEPGFMLDSKGQVTHKKAFVEARVFNSISYVFYRLKVIIKGLLKLDYENADYGTMGRWFNRRSHDKMVLADIAYPERSVAITGGRNLSIVYYALPEYTAKTYNDAEVLKRDDVVNNKTGVMLAQTIGEHFNQLFYHKGNLVLAPNTWEKTDNRQFKRMEKALPSLLPVGSDVAKKIDEMIAQDFLNQGLTHDTSHFVSEIQNISRPQIYMPGHIFDPVLDNKNSIIANTTEVMTQAKKSIQIVSPYLYLSKEEMIKLLGWLKLDPQRKLQIITNSILTTDNLPAQGMVDIDVAEFMTQSEEAKKLASQIEFLQLGKLDDIKFMKDFGGDQTYGKLHAKFSIIDGAITLVTTSNADPRSRKLNSELGFISQGDTSEFTEYFNDLRSKSYPVFSPEWETMVTHKKLRLKKKLSEAAFRCTQALWFLKLKQML